MADMILESPVVSKIVHDYDIIFEAGMAMPLTIDLTVGDTIEFDLPNSLIRAHLVAKPSQTDTAKLLPAEDVTIFVAKVATIQHRERRVVEQSPDERAEWKKLYDELTTKGSTLN